jgi:hypothetical protein
VSSTEIILEHNQSNAILSAELMIFNQNGKMIFNEDVTPFISTYTVGPIHWNGCTESGDKLQNGVYFARMRLRTASDEIMTPAIKMLIFEN